MATQEVKVPETVESLRAELEKARLVNVQLVAETANAYKVASTRADEIKNLREALPTKAQVDELFKQFGIFANKVLALEHQLSESKKPQPSSEKM